MGKAISIEKKLYEDINGVVLHNPKEQMMLFGGKTVGDSIIISPKSLKWFTENEIIYRDGKYATIDEGLLVRSVLNICNMGYDSIFLIHSHKSENKMEDFLNGSLSNNDLKNSKKIFLICQFKNVKYFDGVSTGKSIYFWSIDNEFLKPVQINCYVDGKEITGRVPNTIQELIDVIQENNNGM